MHHRKVWPIRDRFVVGVYVVASWMLFFVAYASARYWAVPFALWFIWRSDRAFTREWLNACERAGVDERDTTGVL